MNTKRRPRKYMTKTRKARLTSEALSVLGRIGGRARAEKLTPEERKRIAIKASKAAAVARTKKARRNKGAGK